MFMKTYTKIKNYLTSVIIKKIQNMTMVQITVVVDELKYEDYKNVLIIMSYMWHDLN